MSKKKLLNSVLLEGEVELCTTAGLKYPQWILLRSGKLQISVKTENQKTYTVGSMIRVIGKLGMFYPIGEKSPIHIIEAEFIELKP
jgi:hypothetical protein